MIIKLITPNQAASVMKEINPYEDWYDFFNSYTNGHYDLDQNFKIYVVNGKAYYDLQDLVAFAVKESGINIEPEFIESLCHACIEKSKTKKAVRSGIERLKRLSEINEIINELSRPHPNERKYQQDNLKCNCYAMRGAV